MTKNAIGLTTQEYASRAGVSPSTVTKWLRDGTLKGEKVSGRWRIPESQLQPSAPPEREPASGPAAGGDRPALTVEAFAERTYLTPAGVVRYLRSGRLCGRRDGEGRWMVDAECLELPAIRHLLRK